MAGPDGARLSAGMGAPGAGETQGVLGAEQSSRLTQQLSARALGADLRKLLLALKAEERGCIFTCSYTYSPLDSVFCILLADPLLLLTKHPSAKPSQPTSKNFYHLEVSASSPEFIRIWENHRGSPTPLFAF